MNKKDKIEILAPAGSVDRMKAAFAAGADACYIGGRNFGARAYAENPLEDALVEAIHYAHLHEKKLFLTINTLLKEKELRQELYSYVKPYYEAGIDAVLVQDLGVLKFLHENFPDLSLHASTQMTICDTGVMKELRKYNVERLVLSRELSLTEIEKFKETGLEIECFVHGALCVCYSGQCSMSYFNGGRSGNRGSCAGSCRMSYNLYEAEKKKELTPNRKIAGEPYLLSPKDMCAIDYIPEMFEAGIYSFKIEGRMKRVEYAALTSYLYRKWADYYLEHGKEAFKSKEATRERKSDIEKLSDIYNRGSFTSGYLFQHNGKDMMADRRPNHNGVLVAKVGKVGTKTKKNVMEVIALKELNPQDVVEVRDERDESKEVYEFTLKEGKKKGEKFFTNFTMGLNIHEGMRIFRTKNDALLKDVSERLIGKGLKRKIKADFEAKVGDKMRLTLSTQGESITILGEEVLEAEMKPVEKERIEKALLKLGDTDFSMEKEEVSIILEGRVFFPMSSLNELRREAAKTLAESIIGRKKRVALKERRGEETSERIKEKPVYMLMFSDTTQVEFFIKNYSNTSTEIEIGFSLDLFPRGKILYYVERLYKLGFPIYLRLPEIFRRESLEVYQRYFKGEVGTSVLRALKGIVVRNLEELTFINEIRKEGWNITILSDTNLHIFNSEAASAFYDMGIDSYTISVEHTIEEAFQVITGLRVPIKVSFIAYGRQEMMVTTQCQWKNKGKCVKELKPKEERLPEILYLENKKSRTNGRLGKFPVAKNCESCNNYIYMDMPINYFKESEVLEKLAPNRIRIDFTFEGEKEMKEVLKLAKLS